MFGLVGWTHCNFYHPTPSPTPNLQSTHTIKKNNHKFTRSAITNTQEWAIVHRVYGLYELTLHDNISVEVYVTDPVEHGL